MTRLELVLLGLLAVMALYLLMLRGWRNRQRQQRFLPAPPASTGTGTTLVGRTPGLFVGTTFAGRWLDRVAVHGLSDRAVAELTVQTDGVHIDREGTGELFLPYAVIDDAGLGDALAGKFMGSGGLLVLTWRLGTERLTSAFRADDHSSHQRLADAVREHLPVHA